MNGFISLTFFLTIVAVTTALWTQHESKKHLHSLMEECFDDPDMGFPKDLKEQFEMEMKVEKATEWQTKMAECMMTKAGFINKEGKIMTEVMKEKIGSEMKDPTKFDEMMEMCNKKMDTIGHTSMELIICMGYFHDRKCGC